MFVRIRWAAALAIILAFLLIFFAWPVGAMLLRGITDDAGALDVSAFGDVLTTGRTWAIVGHTLTMALLGTGGAVLFGIPAAYILYRTDFPGRTLLRSIPWCRSSYPPWWWVWPSGHCWESTDHWDSWA